ncbi:MAG: hypothetical protein CMJ83_00655 [Planctomycetes bacterium]|nr:hypothetical protein [Planctomycetota bacterium]
MTDGGLSILFIVHGFPPEFRGGTELYCLKAAKALVRRGHAVSIVSGSMEGRDEPDVERDTYDGLPVYRIHRQGLFVDNWDKSYAPEVESLLYDVLREIEPDVVHVHHWIRLTRSLVAACCGAGVPAVVTLHDTWSSCARCFRIRDDSFCSRPLSVESCLDCVPRDPWHGVREISTEIELFREDFRQELQLARRRIVPSLAHRDLCAEMTGQAAETFDVVPHGTIAELESKPSPSGDADGPDPDRPIRLGHWGHLYPMKGFHLLLEALHELEPAVRARFAVQCWGEAFDDDYRSKLHGLEDGLAVTWHGKYQPEDLADAELDWVVLPSFAHESYSFVLDEAYRLGFPVIASERGALAERVGEAGLTFQPEDAHDLARTLQRVAETPELHRACREAIPALVTMDAHVETLEAIYRETAGPLAEGLPRPSRALSERHRIHRAFRMEERIRQLMVTRGRVEQEEDKNTGLRREFDKSQDAVKGRDALIAELEGSITEHRSEIDRRQDQLDQNGESRRQVREEIEEGRKVAAAAQDELQDQLTDAHAFLIQGRKELDDLTSQVTEVRGTIVLQAAGLEERDARLGELVERLAEASRAVEDYREVVGRADARVEELKQEIQKAGRREGDLRDDVEGLRAERARIEAALKGVRAEVVVRDEQIQERDDRLESGARDRERLDTTLSEEKAHAHRLQEEKIELGGRAVSLQATLQDLDGRARGVVTALGRLANELGLPPPLVGDDPLLQLAGLVDTLAPVVIENRNLMGEMVKSVDKLSAEAQILEEERSRVQDQLDAEVRARVARRRRWWFRTAEWLAGGPSDAAAPPPLVSEKRGLAIVMVIHDFLPRHAAGSEIYTFKLAKALSADHDVTIVYTEAHQGVHSYFTTEGTYEGLRTIEISHQHTTRYFERSYRDPQMNRLWKDILDRLQPDIVHIQHLHYHSIDYLPITKARGIPIVYTLHEYLLLCPRGGQMLREDMEVCEKPVPEKCADCIQHLSLDSPPEDEGRVGLTSRVARHLPYGMKEGLKRLMPAPGSAPLSVTQTDHAAAISTRLAAIKNATAEVDLFISPSKFLRQKFIDCDLIAPDRIIFSDNGQDDAPFRNVKRKTSDKLRVGYIGTIAEYKGVGVIIDAVNRLTDLEGVRCDIWGSLESFPDFAESLEGRSAHPGMRLRGRYAPKAVGKVLGDLDAIIVPSLWYENSPLTIHEAFMAGIPVIASNFGGMAEFVLHEENGLLFEVGDAEDLAVQIRRLHDDRSLLEKLKNTQVEIKSIEDDARAMLGRYEELIAAARSKGDAS